MNIIEAMKSGRMFRRGGDGGWFYISNAEVYHTSSEHYHRFSATSLLADDWEVEEEKRELRWSEIEKAIMNSIKESAPNSIGFRLQLVKDTLGFGERGNR